MRRKSRAGLYSARCAGQAVRYVGERHSAPADGYTRHLQRAAMSSFTYAENVNTNLASNERRLRVTLRLTRVSVVLHMSVRAVARDVELAH